MADITITATSVVTTAADIEHGIAGATITAGQVVYKGASGKYDLADCDSATAAVKVPRGIALNGAALNQRVAVLKSGDITIGATLTAGLAYYLSPNPGGICAVADVLPGDSVVLIGHAKSTSVLNLNMQVTGVTL